MKLPLLWLAGWGAGLPAKQSHAPEAATRQPDSAEVLRALESLPYRHFTTAGDRALAEWQRLRGLGKGWPVVVGDDEALVELADSYAANAPRSAREILAAARAERLSRGAKTGIDLNDRKQTGDWPATASVEAGLSVARDVLSDKPFPKVHILLLPTADGAEVPAYLRWGNWNECPKPERHVVILRDWGKRYGAELVGISGDVINLRVRRRPATREEALRLAREQMEYCLDIVDQGVGTLAELAASLMSDDWWYFWWD